VVVTLWFLDDRLHVVAAVLPGGGVVVARSLFRGYGSPFGSTAAARLRFPVDLETRPGKAPRPLEDAKLPP
jgi:hypothetical protein